MQPLHEQYRPQTWSDVVGQDKAIAKIEALRRRGLGGRAFWITGQSGTGKTTIGRLIAAELAEPMNVQELDATDMTPAALRDAERSMQFYGMGDKSGRAYEDAHPLLSRCVLLSLARRGLTGLFAARLQSIAEREGLNGQPAEKYQRLLKDRRNNLRAAFEYVEAGGMLED